MFRHIKRTSESFFSDRRGEAAVTSLLVLFLLVNIAFIIANVIIQREQAVIVADTFESVCRVSLSEATNQDYLIDYQGMDVKDASGKNILGGTETTYIDENGNVQTQQFEGGSNPNNTSLTTDVYDKNKFINTLYGMYKNREQWYGESENNTFYDASYNNLGSGLILMYDPTVNGKSFYELSVSNPVFDTENGYVSLVVTVKVNTNMKAFDISWPGVKFTRCIRARCSRVDYNSWNDDLTASYQGNPDADAGIDITKSTSAYNATQGWFYENYIRQNAGGNTTVSDTDKAWRKEKIAEIRSMYR